MALLVPGPRRNHPLPWAIATTALTALTAGTVVGLVAGMAAGTVVIPIIGTMVGGLWGIWIGLLVSAAVTPVLIGLLVVRHRQVVQPHAPLPDIIRLCAGLVVLLVVGGGVGLVSTYAQNAPLLVLLWILTVICATAASLVVALRRAVRLISAVWCRPFGWVTDHSRSMTFVADSTWPPPLNRPRR